MVTKKCSWRKTGKSEWRKGKIFPILEVRKNMSGNYQVDKFNRAGSTSILGVFKNKSQALRKARAYMKKSC